MEPEKISYKKREVSFTKQELIDFIVAYPKGYNGHKKDVIGYVNTIFTDKYDTQKKSTSDRLPTIYQLFCFEHRPSIIEELKKTGNYPDKKDNKRLFTDVTKRLSQMWKDSKDDPMYKKGTEWYKNTLTRKKVEVKKEEKDI